MNASARRVVSKIDDSTTSSESAIAPSAPRPDEIAAYIAQLSGEMALLARGAKLDLLAYFLEMARMEAVSHAER